MIGLTVGRGESYEGTPAFSKLELFLGALGDFFRQLFFLHTYTRAQNMYIYSMFLLNIVWLFCNYPFLSYIAVSNLTAIYILLLHLGSIGQHLQVHSLWGLKCLTSFFSLKVFNIAWKMGTTLVIFLLSFRSVLLSVQCMCVGFSVHVAQQDFYYFKGYQFGGLVFV